MEDDDLFQQAMRGVARLPRGHGVVRGRPGARAKRRTPERAPRFEVEKYGERVEALGVGVERHHLRALERGEVQIDRRVDLHGLSADEAAGVVANALSAARAASERCLLIIHGRGLRSPAAPVLKEAVVDWLTSPPWANHILAFITAPQDRGGGGALLVLLRQGRERK